MVGRGLGKKTGNRHIAPGSLQNCVQASRIKIRSKQNVPASGNNPSITDDIAALVARNLKRQRELFTSNITNRIGLEDHDSHHEREFQNNATNRNIGDGANNSTQHDAEEHESQGYIPPMNEGQLVKRPRESNFASRIELGLQLNEAIDPRPKEKIIPREVTQVNDEERDGNTATSLTKGRGKRGTYKSFVVDMKIKGQGSKLRVTIPEDVDRVIGENARHLVNECGRIVRTKARYDVKNWKEAFKFNGDSMIKEIKERFDFDQSGDYLRIYLFVVETMQRLYRLFKCRLHYHYKNCGSTDEERRKNPPPDLPPSQWEYLIKHYGSEKFKATSAINSKNRKSTNRVKHTTGNLSFLESEDLLTKKNGNVKPSADVIWLVQHTHKNDLGQLEWPSGDTRSKEIHENLKNIVATSGDTMAQEDILTQVLGHKSGYIWGKGTGVRAYVKGKALAEQRKIVEEQQQTIQQQAQEIKELKESVAAIKAQQQEMMEAMNKASSKNY